MAQTTIFGQLANQVINSLKKKENRINHNLLAICRNLTLILRAVAPPTLLLTSLGDSNESANIVMSSWYTNKLWVHLRCRNTCERISRMWLANCQGRTVFDEIEIIRPPLRTRSFRGLQGESKFVKIGLAPPVSVWCSTPWLRVDSTSVLKHST